MEQKKEKETTMRIKLFFLSIFYFNFCTQAQDDLVAQLREEYTTSNYKTYRKSKETTVIKASLDRNEYPVLPISHFWRFDDDDDLILLRHEKSPYKARLRTFGSSQFDKMSYLVEEESTSDGSVRTIYSYTNPRRQDSFTGKRSQKPFKTKNGATYDAGHCIDHIDTPDEELNFYHQKSTHYRANLLPEMPGGWGIKIRPHLAADIRSSHGSYSQFAYYPMLEKRQYTSTPFKTEIPLGVLFFDHDNLGKINQGWQIDWNNHYLNYEAAGQGPRVKLRNFKIRNSQQKQIFSEQRKSPIKLAYIDEDLDSHFSYNLTLPNDGLMDPLTQYRTEVLADGEMVPFYIPYLAENYLKQGDNQRGIYWANRMIAQARLLFDNDIDTQLSNGARNIIKILKKLDPEHDLIDEFKSVIRDSNGIENSPSVVVKVEPESPKKEVTKNVSGPIIIRQKGNTSPPDFKSILKNFDPLVIHFDSPTSKVTGGGKSAITKYFNTVLTQNIAYIQSDLFTPEYIELRGNPNMLSDALLNNIKKVFSKHPIRLFELPKPRRLEF